MIRNFFLQGTTRIEIMKIKMNNILKLTTRVTLLLLLLASPMVSFASTMPDEEEDILIGRTAIPSINYYINDTKHVYFPDFMIKSENKIIEIKSEWTIQLKRGNVEEKALATIKAGYKYEIWVYNDKKVKVQTKVY